MQDHAYFAAIDQEMDNGGREALLHYLLNFDLTQVDLRTVPKTAALLDQQLKSMTPEQAWWFEALMRGALPSRPQGINEPRICLKDDLFNLYILHARIQGINRRSTETKIGIFLSAQLGAKLKDTRLLIHDKQVRCYELPSLGECRKLFAEKLGHPIDWGSEEGRCADWQQSDDWRDALEKAAQTQTGSSFFS